jgi:hypothetical protein
MAKRLALKKQRREEHLLTEDATQSYKRFLEEFGPLADEIALYQVAAHIGVTYVALSRIRKRLNLN